MKILVKNSNLVFASVASSGGGSSSESGGSSSGGSSSGGQTTDGAMSIPLSVEATSNGTTQGLLLKATEDGVTASLDGVIDFYTVGYSSASLGKSITIDTADDNSDFNYSLQPNGTSNLTISDKTKLKAFSLNTGAVPSSATGTIPLALFKDCSSLQRIGDRTWKNVTYGDIVNLKDCPLKFIDLRSNGITGNIVNALGSMTTLQKCCMHAAATTGTVEAFVAAQRSAGRTSGEITNPGGDTYQLFGNGVTFNGTTAVGSLSWTANTITCGGTQISA